MWELYLLRPDAVKALDDPMVKRTLPRYVKVVKDQAIANFQLAKRIEFKQPKKYSIDTLWKTHSKLMKKFYEIRDKVDRDELKLKNLKKPSLLDLKIKLTEEIMKSCELCERKCHVNRMKDERGICKVGNECLISSEFVHVGEESYYIPSHTIFFWSCNMNCVYCQNYSISKRLEPGILITPEKIARAIEKRREEGCRNANFVGGSPTPHLLCILKTLEECKVNVPTLWNSNMMMSESCMKILDGIVDVYLTDLKYGNNKCGLRLSKFPGYWDIATRNHLIAAKQTELTIRHLILPNHLECCTFPVLEWISKNIKDKCIVNIMDQYTPHWKANKYPEINRRITREEYQKALEKAEILGLNVKG